MRKVFPILIFILIALPDITSAQSSNYALNFSTYLGGSDFEHARDVFVDSQGNIYVVGGTNSDNFPTTPGVFQRTHNRTGTQIGSAGYLDVFVSKFSPNGQLIWSTLIGGPNYDRAYAVEVDSQGYVYVAGRAGPSFPTTPSVFQSAFQGFNTGSVYGFQNCFAVKLSPDGSNLIWSSYVGVSSLCRDLAIDSSGDIYVHLSYEIGSTNNPPSSWFTNAYQPNLRGGSECGVAKIKSDGSQVIWATWFGGSGDDSAAASIRVDSNKNVYLGGSTYSTDLPTTLGAADRTQNGGVDFYVAKFSPDGSNLVWATYLGGSGDEWISTHNLAVDSQENAYVSVWTSSLNYPVTTGAFQTTAGGGSSEIAVTKLSPTGALLASTYISGNSSENPDGIYINSSGNVFLTGQTTSTNYPVTSNSYQSTHKGFDDAVIVILSADFSHLIYSTYIGGPSNDAGRSGFIDNNGNLYVVGSSNGANWPVKNAYQSTFQGGSIDNIVAKFSPIAPDTTPPATPTNLQANAVSSSQIDLSWSASTDPESGVSYYKIYRGVTYVSQSTNTTYSDTGLSASTTYTYQVSAVNGVSLESSKSNSVQATTQIVTPPLASLCNGLVLLHHYDNQAQYGETSNMMYDFSGNGNNGTCAGTNCPTWTSNGRFSGAYNFDGSNDYLNLNTQQSLNLQGPLTVSAWIYPYVSNADMIFVEGDAKYLFWIQSNNEIRFADANGHFIDSSPNPLTLNTWNHIIGMFTSTIGTTITTNNAFIYANGASIGNHISGVWTPGSFNAVHIGGSPSWAPMNGLIDEIAIWNRSLTSQEISSLYNSGSPLSCGQAPSNCSDGTLYGQCSVSKPLYCDNGNLIDRCSVCGCPGSKICYINESCVFQIAGDLNNDTKIDIFDLDIVATHFGQTNAHPLWNATADVVANNEIDIFDIVFVCNRFT